MINRLRTPVGSHERFLVVEMFGRNCGMTALMAGYLADADRTLIAEVPFDPDRLAKFMQADRAASAANYAMVIASEGAYPKGGKYRRPVRQTPMATKSSAALETGSAKPSRKRPAPM